MKKIVVVALWLLILGSLYIGLKGRREEKLSEKVVIKKVCTGELLKKIDLSSVKGIFKVKLGDVTLYKTGSGGKKENYVEKNQSTRIFTKGSKEHMEKKEKIVFLEEHGN